MNIRAPDKNLEEPRTLKVSLPVQLHLRLHSIKILQGKNVSDTVREALDDFFEKRADGASVANPDVQTVASEEASAV